MNDKFYDNESLEVFGEERFSDLDPNMRQIEYTASKDPAEWASVQNIVDACIPRMIPGNYSMSCKLFKKVTSVVASAQL